MKHGQVSSIRQGLRPGNPRNHSVAFYQQLEKKLAAKGFHRTDAQTAKEFILEVEKKLSTRQYRPLVERYYQIRFGHQQNEVMGKEGSF